MFKTSALLFLLIGGLGAAEDAAAFRDDYVAACRLLSERYVYLERKLKCSRTRFLEGCLQHAAQVDWTQGRDTFVRELRALMARLQDSHAGWTIPSTLAVLDSVHSLGFISTVGADGRLRVARLVPGFPVRLHTGEEILTLNGEPALLVLDRLGALMPGSTLAATRELAARRLAFERPGMPLRERLDPVVLRVRGRDGREREETLVWKSVELTGDVKRTDQLLMTNFLQPSLEELPEDAEWFAKERLCLYWRVSGARRVAVLHPRGFWEWTPQELDEVFARIEAGRADLLVIDLKDTAGGAFDQVLYMAHQLGITRRFQFFADYIDAKSGMRITGVDDFDRQAIGLDPRHVWRGPTAVRTSTTCMSGADFFPLWFQINHRGFLFGRTTTGAGGGTDEVRLPRTGACISFPLRERIPLGAQHSVEGHGVVPDWETDGELPELLPRLLERMAQTH